MLKLEDVAFQINDILLVLRIYMVRSVRYFSGVFFGSQVYEFSLESQDFIIENDMVMYELDFFFLNGFGSIGYDYFFIYIGYGFFNEYFRGD